ncbi:cytochrome c oxidase accessory protein CcoG [Alteromonas sediminis]|uniref:Cytochrome c oxidase accessory protein CcoG n=2 Tax=Alteromonas sediminis TaxID=2259342 RepID=A0A3N5Z7U5_9ALTE|nr:cytochrome c oxidase accessory protein CcoG [Alteromonas sediminis]
MTSSDKIYIREQFGKFQRIRRWLNFVLVAGFLLLPFIRHNGAQAILIDVATQRIDLFHFSLFPQDLMIIALIFILAAFTLFFVSKRYGRVWCGYACPQTIWTLMFNWVERRVEGSHHQSKAMDNQSWNRKKLAKKITKHTLWLMLSLFTSLTFMSYFEPARVLYSDFFTADISPVIAGWVLFFAVCTYINAGWLREKMCQHACPYSRFQSAMLDVTTKLVAYDASRGESRGPRKRTVAKSEGQGDCVDCNLCVQVCPVGIDIREGLQYECINCGLCVDACDETMVKFNYPKGLIRYTKQSTSEVSFNRANLGYALLILATGVSIIVWGLNRQSFEVNLLRDRQALYRVNTSGHIENTFLLKTLNKTQHLKKYAVLLSDDADFTIETRTEFQVQPGEYLMTPLPVSFSGIEYPEKQIIEFVVEDLQTGEAITKHSTFYAGPGAW